VEEDGRKLFAAENCPRSEGEAMLVLEPVLVGGGRRESEGSVDGRRRPRVKCLLVCVEDTQLRTCSQAENCVAIRLETELGGEQKVEAVEIRGNHGGVAHPE